MPAKLLIDSGASLVYPAGHIAVICPGKDSHQLGGGFRSDHAALRHTAHAVAQHSKQPVFLITIHAGDAESVLLFFPAANAL